MLNIECQVTFASSCIRYINHTDYQIQWKQHVKHWVPSDFCIILYTLYKSQITQTTRFSGSNMLNIECQVTFASSCICYINHTDYQIQSEWISQDCFELEVFRSRIEKYYKSCTICDHSADQQFCKRGDVVDTWSIAGNHKQSWKIKTPDNVANQLTQSTSHTNYACIITSQVYVKWCYILLRGKKCSAQTAVINCIP